MTGALEDTNKISRILHRGGALSFWDYATAAPYVEIDMNPEGSSAEDKVHVPSTRRRYSIQQQSKYVCLSVGKHFNCRFSSRHSLVHAVKSLERDRSHFVRFQPNSRQNPLRCLCEGTVNLHRFRRSLVADNFALYWVLFVDIWCVLPGNERTFRRVLASIGSDHTTSRGLNTGSRVSQSQNNYRT